MREGKNFLAGTIIIFFKKVRHLENYQLSMKYISLKRTQNFSFICCIY